MTKDERVARITKNLLENKTCDNCKYVFLSTSIFNKEYKEINCIYGDKWKDLPKEKTCLRWKGYAFYGYRK